MRIYYFGTLIADTEQNKKQKPHAKQPQSPIKAALNDAGQVEPRPKTFVIRDFSHA